MQRLGVQPVVEELDTYFTAVDVLMNVPLHAYPPEVTSYHINSVTDTLVALSIMKFYNNERRL